MRSNDSCHAFRLMRDPTGYEVEIDEELAPLVELLWASGFETISSCQDAAEDLESFAIREPHMKREVDYLRGYSYVDFDVKSGLAFLDAIANAGPRDAFYVRMVHWAAPGAWH